MCVSYWVAEKGHSDQKEEHTHIQKRSEGTHRADQIRPGSKPEGTSRTEGVLRRNAVERTWTSASGVLGDCNLCGCNDHSEYVLYQS
jgi:hypothetical protein